MWELPSQLGCCVSAAQLSAQSQERRKRRDECDSDSSGSELRKPYRIELYEHDRGQVIDDVAPERRRTVPVAIVIAPK